MIGRDKAGADGACAARALCRICSTCSALTTMTPVCAVAAETVRKSSAGGIIGVFMACPCVVDLGRLARHTPAMTQPPLWKASVALTKAEAADVCAALELDGSAQAVLIVEEPFAEGAVVEA